MCYDLILLTVSVLSELLHVGSIGSTEANVAMHWSLECQTAYIFYIASASASFKLHSMMALKREITYIIR